MFQRLSLWHAQPSWAANQLRRLPSLPATARLCSFLSHKLTRHSLGRSALAIRILSTGAQFSSAPHNIDLFGLTNVCTLSTIREIRFQNSRLTLMKKTHLYFRSVGAWIISSLPCNRTSNKQTGVLAWYHSEQKHRDLFQYTLSSQRRRGRTRPIPGQYQVNTTPVPL
jgi:hypothetical protein